MEGKRREGGESITDVFPLLYELAHACPGYLCLLPFLSKEMLWRGKWQPTPVLLPEKSHGQRSLAGYSSCGHKRVTYNLATIPQQQPCGSQPPGTPSVILASIYTPGSLPTPNQSWIVPVNEDNYIQLLRIDRKNHCDICLVHWAHLSGEVSCHVLRTFKQLCQEDHIGVMEASHQRPASCDLLAMWLASHVTGLPLK